MRSHPWLTAAFFCLLVIGGLATTKYFQISALMAYAESYPPENQSISTTEVLSGTYQANQIISAQVVAPNDMSFTAEVASRIDTVHVKPGQVISANTVLITLDQAEEQAKLKAAKANLRLAEISLNRSKSLNDKSLNSQEQVDIATAKREAALADIDYLNAMIRKKTIISPIQGMVGLHQFNAGEYVNAGQTLLRVVDQTGDVWIDFELPQTLPKPSIGSFLTILDSQDNLIGNAEVIASDAWIKHTNGNIKMRLQFDNTNGELAIGEFVKVRIPYADNIDVLIVPTTSVRRDVDGAFVFAVNDSEPNAFLPHRAALKRVEIIAQQGNNFLVTGDIKAGVVIASLGAFKLKDGVLLNASGLSAGE